MENDRDDRIFSRQFIKSIGACMLAFIIRFVSDVAAGVCMQLEPPLYQAYALPARVAGSVVAGIILGWVLLRSEDGMIIALMICSMLFWFDPSAIYTRDPWVFYGLAASVFLGGISYTALARRRYRRLYC